MKRSVYMHYHNLVGDRSFTTEVHLDEGETERQAAEQLLPKSSAKLIAWMEDTREGLFAIGPLVGIVVFTETPNHTMGAIEATRIWIDGNKHMLPEVEV